jgi:hypothetical protein
MDMQKPFTPLEQPDPNRFTAPTDIKFKHILSKGWLITIFGLMAVIAVIVVVYYVSKVI